MMIYYKLKEYIRNIKKRLYEDKLVVSVLTLMGGAAAAQAIPILISPIISRIYDVEDFGVLSVYTSLAAMIGIVATGRYELAVMLPGDDEDAANITALSIIISTIISVISLVVFCTFNLQITTMLGDARISRWLYFIPLSVLMSGIYETLNYWTNRKERYKRLTISRIMQSIIVGALNLGLGFAGAGISGLIVCGLLSQLAAVAVLLWSAVSKDRHLVKVISWTGIKNNAVKYKDFPLVNSFHAFADIIQSSGIVLLISAFYGSKVLGLYSFTLKVLKIPMGLIGSAVGQVFYQQASAIYNEKGDLRRFVKKITVRQGLLAIPAVIILLLFAPGMFRVFLGEKWYEAGIYAQIFAPSVFMHFIVSPISYIPIIVNRQKTAFIIGLASNLLDIAAVVSGSYIGNDVKTGFYILTFVRLVTLILTLIWYYKISASIKGGTEAKSKSSKDKADIKVKLPKDELEIETNKIKYKMKIIIIGLPYFACRLAKSLSHFDRDNSYVAIDMNRGILSKLKYIFHLINADIVYSIGGFVVYSRSAAMAFLLKKKFIMEWVGSDVLNARRAYKENLVDMKIIQQSIHFCEAPWIQKDLAQLGIKTEILYFFTFNTEERQIYKLPDKFSILSYVNESRQEFYGIDNLIRLARDFPKIEVRIAGMKTTQKELPQNIKLLGWVKDMGEFYKGCVLFLRLTEHDGLAFSVREALGVGRYVGYSYKYDKTFFVDSYSSLKSLVLELCRSFYNNSLVFNYNGMDFIAKTFSEKKVLGNLVNKFKKIIEN